jgi:hypothetical protein
VHAAAHEAECAVDFRVDFRVVQRIVTHSGNRGRKIEADMFVVSSASLALDLDEYFWFSPLGGVVWAHRKKPLTFS